MKSIEELASRYSDRFGHQWKLEELPPPAQARVIIVIPSYDEEPAESLASLGHCAVEEGTVDVLLVFNHSAKAPEEVKQKHARQAQFYHGLRLENGLPVYSMSAFDLPPKHAGVGLARKIGMDAALQRFARGGHDGLILCFDADSTVSANYLQEVLQAEKAGVNGLSIYFEHPLEKLPPVEAGRIAQYEIWLRYYVQALRFSGYPHAFHTIGSSMAVRASAYAKIGGMNRRKAGEDFYFLHKLIPHGNFHDLTTCSVFPSSRISERVPFGTGRAMLEMETGNKDFRLLYHPQIFRELKTFHEMGEQIFYRQLEHWPQSLAEFFDKNGYLQELQALQKRSAGRGQLLRNFHFWWDGFKVLKYVHFARDHYFGQQPAHQAAEELFGFAPGSSLELLESLRKLDRVAGKSLI